MQQKLYLGPQKAQLRPYRTAVGHVDTRFLRNMVVLDTINGGRAARVQVGYWTEDRKAWSPVDMSFHDKNMCY